MTLLILGVAPAGGLGDEPRGRTLLAIDGAAVEATLQKLQTDWTAVVEVDGVRKELKPSDYVLWGRYEDQDRDAQVLLADGTVLVGDLVRIEADSVTIASRLWGELLIPRRLLHACLLLPAADPLQRDRQWQRLQQPQPADRILLLNGDTLSGRVLPTTENEEGGLFGLVSVGIEFSSGGPSTSVPIEEVQAIAFSAVAMNPPLRQCLLGFRDGSLVAASQLEQLAGDRVRITTTAGATLQLGADAWRQNLSLIQPHNDTVQYLSDLPAIGYKSLPFLTLDWPLGVARNTLGGRLRQGGRVIFAGLGMHSESRVVYQLDGQYRRFQAELALDDHAGREGSVIYRVLVERETAAGQFAWQLDYTSPIIRGGEAPLPLDLDVTGAARLALVVEMADRVITRDYANWLNARLVR